MTALTEALAACIQIHDNQQALADPVAMTAAAELAFKQAVVAAIDEMLTNTAMVGVGQIGSNVSTLAMLEAENAALTAKVQAGEAAIEAFDAVLHPAEPSSTEPVAPAAEIAPTIAPTTGA